MKKIVGSTLSFVCILAVAMCSIFCFASYGTALAASESERLTEIETIETEGITRSSNYNLSLSIGLEDTIVVATAKNEYAFFVLRIKVYVQLYCSDTVTDYQYMDLVASNYTDDLNMGCTLVTASYLFDTPKYWRARIYYKVDNLPWEELVTGAHLH